MAGLYLGSDELFKAALGSDEVEVYLGDELLWPQGPSYKALITLTGGTTVEIPANGSSELTSGEVVSNVSNVRNIASVEITSAVTSLGAKVFSGANAMSSVTISNGVTSIGASGFTNCSRLSSVTIPDSVTSIGNYAFWYASNLSGITMSSNLVTIGKDAFAYSKLTAITIPDTVTSIGESAFSGTKIKDITFSSGMTSIPPKVFWACTSLSSVTIPNSITSIGDAAFNACSALTSITIPNTVTSIGANTFNSCTALTAITIPSGVTVINDALFGGCSALTGITIPSGVTSIGTRAFTTCRKISGVTIPNAVTAIGDGAFIDCSALTDITIPSGVTSIGTSAFTNTVSISSMTVDANNSTYDSRNGCNAIIETSTNKLVAGCKNTVIPNTVTSIGNYAFNEQSTLTGISIPTSVTSIGEGAFLSCYGLTNMSVPDSVTTIGARAFQSCTGLLSINIPSGVTSIEDSTFNYCRNLTGITIPSGVTIIKQYAFYKCSALTGITIEATTPPTLSGYSWFPKNCPLYIPCGTLTAYTAATNWSSLSSRMQEYGCSDGPSATIHLKYYSDDGCDGEGCDIEEDRHIYGEITRAAVESAITDHDDVEDMDVVRWGDVVYIEVASGVTSIGAEAFNFADDPMDGWKILYVKFLGTTPPTIGAHAFGGGHEFDSMRYYILAPSAATTAYTSAFSAQSADFDGVYPSDAPCMAAVTSSWDGDPPTTSTTYVYGPATMVNLAKNLGVWNAELGEISWGDFGGQIEEVRIGSAATSIAADAFSNTAESVNCDDGVFKWIIDTDTVTSIGVDAFAWLNMREVWLSGSTNVLHLDAMDHASFKALCTCPQYDEGLDEDVDVDTWFNYNIYVDDTLLSAYQADSKWSGYGNRLKGESDWEEPEIDWCNHIDDEEPQIEP